MKIYHSDRLTGKVKQLPMKKLLGLTLLVLMIIGFPAVCWADQAISVKLDGQQLAFDPPPLIKEGRIMVPLESPMEALGCTVTWDAAAQQTTITSGSTIITFRVGSTKYTVNNQEKTMDVAPEIVGDRNLFPLRYAVESVGASVTWDSATQTVNITSPQLLHTPDGLTADQLIDKANQTASAKNTYKFREQRQINVKNSMDYSWGKSEHSNDISYAETDGYRKYDSPGKYESIKEGIPPVNGKAMVVDDSYEKVTSDNGIYVKSPTGVWVKTDEQTPEEFLQSMGKSEEDMDKDLVFVLGPDEKVKDKDCQVVTFSYKPEFFQPLIKNLVEQQLDTSETEPAINQSIWEQVGENMKATGSGKFWLDKATGLELQEESSFTISFSVIIPVPEANSHTMHYSYDMQDTSQEQHFDYGAQVAIPDVSKAISSEDYTKIQSKLFDAGLF